MFLLYLRKLHHKKASQYKQVDLRTPLTNIYFSFKLAQCFFPPLFNYHVVFQNQSGGCIGGDDIIEMNEISVL